MLCIGEADEDEFDDDGADLAGLLEQMRELNRVTVLLAGVGIVVMLRSLWMGTMQAPSRPWF